MSTNTSNNEQEANFLEEDDDAGSDEEAGAHYDSPHERKCQLHDELDTIP